MREVSCRVTAFLLARAAEQGVSHEILIGELSTSKRTLLDVRERISWELFTRLLERAETLLGGPEALVQLSQTRNLSPHFALFTRMASLFVSARDIYWMGTRWYGNQLFENVRADYVALEAGRIRVTLTIPEGDSPSIPFFHLMLGAMCGGPQAVGLGIALVEHEIAPQRATYLITPPPPLSFYARLRRAVGAVVRSKGAISELAVQQEELRLRNEELRQETRRVEAQAAQLAEINQLGRQLAEKIEIEDLASAIVELVKSLVPCEGVRLSVLQGDEEGLRALRSEGRTAGRHTSHTLIAAGRCVGELAVWEGEASGPSAERPTLLEELLPWISIALENARSFRGLRDRAQARLLAARQLASIGTLAAGIAHEINNPVGSILASAEYALRSRGSADADRIVEQSLENVVLEAQRCGRIVKSVLQFAREEETEKWPEDLNDVVRRAIGFVLKDLGEHDANVELELADGPIRLVMNPIQMEQVVVNLVRNAIQAGPQNSHVFVRTSRSCDGAKLSVSDSGCGIESSDLGHVFDPFYSTHAATGGTGLGLSIVHGIVREHGGSVELDSAPGRGTSVTVRLPAGQASPELQG